MCQCVFVQCVHVHNTINIHTFMWHFSQPWYKQYRSSISALLLLKKNNLFLYTIYYYCPTDEGECFIQEKKRKVTAWISPPARFDLNQFNCFVCLLFQDLNKSRTGLSEVSSSLITPGFSCVFQCNRVSYILHNIFHLKKGSISDEHLKLSIDCNFLQCSFQSQALLRI